jgi:hypothetical protein
MRVKPLGVFKIQAAWIHRNLGNRIHMYQSPHTLVTIHDRNQNNKI